MFLLDTNVVSELRKGGRADPNVIRWADGVEADLLHISVITLMELEIGVLQIERQDPAQGTILRAWLDTRVLPAFDGRILPVDVDIARRCARILVPDRWGERDALIAATALAGGMTVVTRNVGDFLPMGVPLHNPWVESAPA
jgi:toxin FitB